MVDQKECVGQFNLFAAKPIPGNFLSDQDPEMGSLLKKLQPIFYNGNYNS